MDHSVKMKKGISKLVTFLLPNMNHLEGEISHKRNQPNKQSTMPFLTRACQLLEGQTVNVYPNSQHAFGMSMIWGCYGNKGVFLRPLGPQ